MFTMRLLEYFKIEPSTNILPPSIILLVEIQFPVRAFRRILPGQHQSPNAGGTERLDRFGAVASITCAVHCALMPVLVTVLPVAIGVSLSSSWVEWALFGASLTIGLASLCRGYRIHGNRLAQVAFSAGLATLGAGRIEEERGWGVVPLVAGGLTLAIAHLINLRLCRTCPSCSRG